MLIQHELTSSQKDALDLDYNIFVEAGAGSGKTAVLVQRFLTILEKNPLLEVYNILAITFTNKAAGEMMNRIQKYLQHPSCSLTPSLRDRIYRSLGLAKVSTIHSFCNSVLRKYPAQAKIAPDFSLLETEQSLKLQYSAIDKTIYNLQKKESSALKTYLLNFSVVQLKKDLLCLFKEISISKDWIGCYLDTSYQEKTINNLIDKHPEKAVPTATAFKLVQALGTIFRLCLDQYEKEKKLSGKCDYHDLLVFTENLLRKNEDVRSSYQQMLQFILVDEFQDTDPLQWEIIKLLIGDKKKNKLFIVGDVKQSIYSFRGADASIFPKVLQKFYQEKNNSKIVRLSDNFRSQKVLIDFYNMLFQILFSQNTSSPLDYSPLLPRNHKDTGNVEFAFISNDYSIEHEAKFIASWIINNIKSNPEIKLKDFAILLRRKKNMELIKGVLSGFNIPSTIYSGKGLFKEEEVIDLCNLVKALANPNDNLAWIGILKSPLFGVADETLFLLYTDFPEDSLLTKLSKFSVLDEKLRQKKGYDRIDINLLLNAVIFFTDWLRQKDLIATSSLLKDILLQTKAWIKYKSMENGSQKTHNIKSLIKKIQRIEETTFTTISDIASILTQAIENPSAESTEIHTPEDNNAVSILSVHAAKGLEFPIVIIPECGTTFNFNSQQRLLINKDKGIGLSFRTKDNQQNVLREIILTAHKNTIIEEEKRIFYVSCTRAKDKLLLMGRERHKAGKKDQLTSYLDFIKANSAIDPINKKIFFCNHSKKLSFPFYNSLLKEDKLTADKNSLTETNISKIIVPDFSSKKNLNPSVFIHIPTSDLVSFLVNPKLLKLKPILKKINKNSFLNLLDNDLQRLLKSNCEFKTLRQPLPIPANILGSLVHKAFEILNKEPKINPEILIQDLIQSLTYSEKTKIKITSVLQQQIELYFKSSLFDQIKNANEQYHEKNFNIKLGNLLVEGRIDSLIKTNTEWLIIDYKSDQVDLENLENQAEKYRYQIGIYLLAVRKMYKLNTSSYKAALYFSWLGKTHLLNFSKNDLDTLLDIISTLNIDF